MGVGAIKTSTFIVANFGISSLDVSAVTLSGSQLFGSPATSFTIAAGSSDTFTITFDASGGSVAPGPNVGFVTIHNTDSDEYEYTFPIEGTVLASTTSPEIEIEYEDTIITSVVDGDTVDFGILTQGGTSTLTFTIGNTNPNTVLLVSDSFTLNGDPAFSIPGGVPSSSIPFGGNAMFEVSVDRTHLGQFSAYLQLLSNDGNNDEIPFNIYFNAAVGRSPQIEVSRESTSIAHDTTDTNFGVTLSGAPVDVTFTISNSGDADLVIDSVLSVPDGFSIVSFPSSSTITGGGLGVSRTFVVRLDAVMAGDYSGYVVFGNNDSDESPFRVPVNGVVQNIVYFWRFTKPQDGDVRIDMVVGSISN